MRGREPSCAAFVPPAPDPSRLAVGITAYHPAPGQLTALLDRLPAGVAVLVFDNGGLPPEDRDGLARAGATILSDGQKNLGIAAALNRLADAARAAGADGLLLLDQDAAPDPALPAALLAARDRLRAASRAAAVVGPAPAAAAGHKPPARPPRPGVAPVGPLAPVQFLATSGSLIDLDAFARVGPFRADFFIDGVELEWCFRAWARGFGCYLDASVTIPHRVGAGTIRFLGLATPRQPLPRMATYLRNSLYAWRLPHVPLRWKLAQGLYLPVQAALYWADAGFRPAVLARLGAAARDGLLGRLGQPRDLP
ncbi:rhamnosyltransferase [Methylobacterium sp. NEAU 140]|uniref:glycosyltransferase family 2 protein n=1 Tax=Methylobacterium sp. NEAU 140 TaxID=3064945 RepID=UPI002735B69E|nr:glycosyltransferase family 2 protein [Methylobacterium sp. NEAU 140]MDP4023388.1 rhamnosyltransferase [Methylobacterium sp. NEAU 140]